MATILMHVFHHQYNQYNLAISTILLHSTGVQWVEMHKLAERVELEELKNCGIFHGNVEEMMKVNKVTLKDNTMDIQLSNAG